MITAEDSTSTVIWRGASNGSTSVSGGEAVTGWTATTDPSLPKGTMAAPAPKLPSGVARHLYVDGVRAFRTRVNASLVLPGGKADKTGALLANMAIQTDTVDGQEHADSYRTPHELNWSNPIDVELVYPPNALHRPLCSASMFHASKCRLLCVSVSVHCRCSCYGSDGS